jgi:hypothetical protein
MLHVKQSAKRKRRGKAVPMLGAAGLSLSLAGGASAAIGGPTAGLLTQNADKSHEITLRDEEMSDVNLATFYVFDKESAKPVRRGGRLAMGGSGCGCAGCGCLGGCGGCWGGSYETPAPGGDADPPHHATKPAHKPGHAGTHVSKNQ